MSGGSLVAGLTKRQFAIYFSLCLLTTTIKRMSEYLKSSRVGKLVSSDMLNNYFRLYLYQYASCNPTLKKQTSV